MYQLASSYFSYQVRLHGEAQRNILRERQDTRREVRQQRAAEREIVIKEYRDMYGLPDDEEEGVVKRENVETNDEDAVTLISADIVTPLNRRNKNMIIQGQI